MGISNTQSNPYARNLSVVKMYFKKPMALLICVVTLAVFILSIVASLQIVDWSNNLWQSLANAYDVTLDAQSTVTINPLNFLISGIVLLCFFMIYFFSKSANGNPSFFFSVLHVFSAIYLVLSAIATVFILVVFLIAIFSTSSIANAVASSMGSFDPAQFENIMSSFRITLIIMFLLVAVIMGVALFFINSQTAFLKSCKRSCNEPSLFTKGANAFGTLSIVMALLQLVFLVIVYLMFTSFEDFGSLFGTLSFPMSYVVLCVLTPINTILKGIFAKGWVKFAQENESYVYAAASAASRSPEVNPIATFKADQRSSNSAIKQSQPYLYGEEENKDPNKKSSYIPEELQQDYPAQQYDQNPFAAPMQFDPQYVQQPMQQPMQQEPFAQSPMGNPYGQPPMQNPNQNPYNNGMM